MSISSALSSALSGLSASSRQAQVISNNLANALTPGYGVRRVGLTTPGDGQGTGVLVTGVTRDVDQTLLSDRRRADSDVAFSTTKADFFADLERVLGTPEDAHSLTSRLADFEASLASAAVRPEEESRLQAAVLAAQDITRGLNETAGRVQVLRTDAESRIRQDVDDTNRLLQQVQSLNSQVVDARNRGNPTASFEDQRRLVLDNLAEIVPLRTFVRESGEVALYTPKGAVLLDGSAAEFSFSASSVITADMTQGNGLLSGLQINGISVITSGDASPLDGGRLAANFEIRDELAVDAQTQLDAVARDLVTRFQQTGLDATRNAGDPGLFTDQGAAFDPLNEVGLSRRIDVSDAVRPDEGGAYWRLRDGLFAVAPGPVGDGALLQGLNSALSDSSTLASGDLGATERGAPGHVAAMMSYLGQQRLALDQSVSFARSNQAGLVEAELSLGVNSDEELQRLLLVEQSYSANARLIQTVEDMIDTLLRI